MLCDVLNKIKNLDSNLVRLLIIRACMTCYCLDTNNSSPFSMIGVNAYLRSNLWMHKILWEMNHMIYWVG